MAEIAPSHFLLVTLSSANPRRLKFEEINASLQSTRKNITNPTSLIFSTIVLSSKISDGRGGRFCSLSGHESVIISVTQISFGALKLQHPSEYHFDPLQYIRLYLQSAYYLSSGLIIA